MMSNNHNTESHYSSTFVRTKTEMDELLRHGASLKQYLDTIRSDFQLLVNDFASKETGRSPSIVLKASPSKHHRRCSSVHRKSPSRYQRTDQLGCMTPTGRKQSRLNMIENVVVNDEEDKENASPRCGSSSYGTENLLKSQRKMRTPKGSRRQALSPLCCSPAQNQRNGRDLLNVDKSCGQKTFTVPNSSNQFITQQGGFDESCLCSSHSSDLSSSYTHLNGSVLPVRTPGDGASASPCSVTPSPTSPCKIHAKLSAQTSTQNNELPSTPVLPVADILLHRRRNNPKSSHAKSPVLGGISLRGLDGTDLSASPSGHIIGDMSNININEISKIKTPKMNPLAMSLRERTSSTNVAGAMHSTLNYPLHSTLKNTMLINGIEPICEGSESRDNDTWSTDSSEFSYDVDETVRKDVPMRPTNPAVPCSFDYNDMSYSDTFTSHQVVSKARQVQRFDSASCDSTIIENTIIHEGNIIGNKQEKNRPIDLDKTVHTGCIGLLRKQKLKATKHKKQKCLVKSRQSVLLACSLPRSKATHVKHNDQQNPTECTTKNTIQREKIINSVEQQRCLRTEIEQVCRQKLFEQQNDDSRTSNDRRLSHAIRNTPGAIHYELDSDLNVLAKPLRSSVSAYPPCSSKKALKRTVKRKRSILKSGNVEFTPLGRL